MVCFDEPEVAVSDTTVLLASDRIKLLLHEQSRDHKRTGKARRIKRHRGRFVLRSKQHRSRATNRAASSALKPFSDAAVVADAEIVIGADVAMSSGEGVAREQLHVAPKGSPEELKKVDPLNPFTWVTVIPPVPFYPAITATEFGNAVIDMFCIVVTACANLQKLLRKPLLPIESES